MSLLLSYCVFEVQIFKYSATADDKPHTSAPSWSRVTCCLCSSLDRNAPDMKRVSRPLRSSLRSDVRRGSRASREASVMLLPGRARLSTLEPRHSPTWGKGAKDIAETLKYNVKENSKWSQRKKLWENHDSLFFSSSFLFSFSINSAYFSKYLALNTNTFKSIQFLQKHCYLWELL